MEKLFVPYELALKLKEKGFDEICLGFYSTKYNYSEKNFKPKLFISTNDKETQMIRNVVKDCSAPIYGQVIEWLDTKNIHIQIHSNFQSPYIYGFKINKRVFLGMPNKFEFRKEAQIKAIEDSLKMI